MEECIQEKVTVKTNAPSGWIIFLQFLKLGCTAFGGPAIIAHIRELVVHQKNWLDNDTFRDGVVLSQSIPGATAMQVAAYVGLKTQGIGGAAAAYIGLGVPAFIMMLMLSAFYATSRNVAPIVALFNGLQVFVVGIVAHAAFSFGREIFRSAGCLFIAASSAALLFIGAGPFSVIFASGVTGAFLFRDIVIPPAASRPSERTDVPRILAIAGAVGGAGLTVVYLANPQLFSLSVLMVRINSLAFGGGLSALPLMHHEIVSRGWMESRAFMDGIALGQVTPGPISITGTFIGFLLFGFFGGIVATAATFAPPFVMLVASEPYFERMKTSQLFARASRGIMCCFVGLLVYVAYRFALDISWDWPRIILVGAVFGALVRKVDVLLVILVAAIFSVVRL